MLTDASLPSLLRLLGDPTRLRVLAVLERQELCVGDLARVLASSQSRVSNHLKLMRAGHLLAERHEGKNIYLRAQISDSGPLTPSLWTSLRSQVVQLTEHAGDIARLDALREEREGRERAFFDRVAADWDKLGTDFSTGQARQRALAQLLQPDMCVADLGCGTGYFSRALFGLVSQVICVDRSAAMLEQARQRLLRHETDHKTRLEFRQGELEALPLADGEVDGVLCGMVLHHVRDLGAVMAELYRVLRPAGRAVALELVPHRAEWMHQAQGDRFLGLSRSDVAAAFERAGFRAVRVEDADDRYRAAMPRPASGADGATHEFELYLVRAQKPART